MSPKTVTLKEYRRGWSDGAAGRPPYDVVFTAAYARGHADGLNAFRNAMAEERARLSLRPDPTEVTRG